jgi:hypothetical protein
LVGTLLDGRRLGWRSDGGKVLREEAGELGVLEAFQAVLSAAGAGLFGGVGEEWEGLRTLAMGLGGARGRGLPGSTISP